MKTHKSDVADDIKDTADDAAAATQEKLEDAKDSAEEKAQDVKDATQETSDNSDEATDTDTTNKSTEQSEQDEPTPVEETAADQEDEQDDADGQADESTPAQANDDTSEVEKSAIFGAYAQADAAEVSVRALTSDLGWEVWRAVYSDEEDERSKDERKAHVAAALAEYSQIVQSVANAFIENGIDASAEKSFVVPNEEAINKSLTEKDTKVEELTKSLSTKDKELLQVRKLLEKSQSEVEKMKARKSLVFDKFAGAADEIQKADDEAKAQEEANKLFANFVITGAK